MMPRGIGGMFQWRARTIRYRWFAPQGIRWYCRDSMEPFEQLAATLEANDVAYAGVFGSVARGEDRPESDVDILIKFDTPKSLLDIVRIERELSGQLGREVDLVTEASLSPYIRNTVLRDVRMFYGSR